MRLGGAVRMVVVGMAVGMSAACATAINYDGPHLSQAQDSYTKLNLSVRLNAPADRYYVEMFGDNVTDEDTKNFWGFNRGVVKGYYDPPRIYGLRMGYSFE